MTELIQAYLQTADGCPPRFPIQRDVLVIVLGKLLTVTFSQGATVPLLGDEIPTIVQMFQSKSVPSLSVDEYFRRLANDGKSSEEALIIAMVYMTHIFFHFPYFPVNILTIHRLLLISVMVATKFHDDTFRSNKHFAKVGGVSLKEINALEEEFLAVFFNFNVFVSAQDYARIFQDLTQSRAINLKMFLIPSMASVVPSSIIVVPNSATNIKTPSPHDSKAPMDDDPTTIFSASKAQPRLDDSKTSMSDLAPLGPVPPAGMASGCAPLPAGATAGCAAVPAGVNNVSVGGSRKLLVENAPTDLTADSVLSSASKETAALPGPKFNSAAFSGIVVRQPQLDVAAPLAVVPASLVVPTCSHGS